MQGFLWLLLQMSLLLLAAAVVFFWLGWHWRGQNAHARIADLNKQIDAESRAAETARKECEAALEQLRGAQHREASELKEAQDRQRGLEREILRLSDDLKAAQSSIRAKVEVATVASEPIAAPSAPSLEPEVASAPSSPETALPILATPAIKEARPKKLTSAAAKGTKAITARNTLKRLEKSVAQQETLIEKLREKRDEWQMRLTVLKAQKDAAGLKVATKNLKTSNTQLDQAAETIRSQQNQIRALTRNLETPVSGTEDDLTRIKGIKPSLQEQLHTFGIQSYRQLAEWNDEDIHAFADLLSVKKRGDLDRWRIEARELVAAKTAPQKG